MSLAEDVVTVLSFSVVPPVLLELCGSAGDMDHLGWLDVNETDRHV